jgi:conjugative relaxase-like TrwC/TraI family protein
VLTAKTQYNLTNAREYFEEHLCVGDYYDEGQRVAGQWIGAGAEQLGLTGKVRADDFLRLCENQHPATGETLTQRLNTVRIGNGKEEVNRRVFYDSTFSPPKSVSVAALAGADERIVAAHGQAVWSAMRELETFAATRVRAGGGHEDRSTGNVAAALFTHDTSRALDPHLHTHCVVFNATFDPVEQRWKALQNYEMLLAKKFTENVYYHELARQLRSFGYQINNHPRGDFQIEGVSEAICDRFSKRDAEVDKALAKLLADKPELAGANIKEIRAKLAVKTRASKQKDLSRAELRTLWNAQLSEAERISLRQLPNRFENIANTNQRVEIGEAVQWAEDHLFDRNSVVLECQLWQQALERARAENFTVTELKDFTRQRNYIRNAEHPKKVTLREVLSRELEIVQSVKDGVMHSSKLGPRVAVWAAVPFWPTLHHLGPRPGL